MFVNDDTFNELYRKVAHYEQAGMFLIDARKFLTEAGSPILAEIHALQTKVEKLNYQADLDVLPSLDEAVEQAKDKARECRDRYQKHERTRGQMLNDNATIQQNYQNAANRLGALKSVTLDRFSPKSRIESHNEDIRKAQSEATDTVEAFRGGQFLG